jgi:hypothetical protein
MLDKVRNVAFVAALIASVAPGRVAAATVDPGIIRAANTEMHGFAGNNFREFIGAFTDNPTLIDDSEPFFMEGPRQLHEWFKDTWTGVTSIVLVHQAATDYALRANRAYAVFPFKITFGTPSGSFSASGAWSGTFQRGLDGSWKIRSLTISLLGFGSG